MITNIMKMISKICIIYMYIIETMNTKLNVFNKMISLNDPINLKCKKRNNSFKHLILGVMFHVLNILKDLCIFKAIV